MAIEGQAPSVQERLEVINRFSSEGVFVRAVCTPLIGNRNDAKAIKEICFDNGARAFKHKGVISWDEKAFLDGERMWNRGNQEEVFDDLWKSGRGVR